MVYLNLIFLICVFISTSFAVSTFQADCPQKITGKVRMIQDLDATDHSFAKQKITLEVSAVHQGQVESEIEVISLKFGPWAFQVGESYEISMNEGKLCFVEDRR